MEIYGVGSLLRSRLRHRNILSLLLFCLSRLLVLVIYGAQVSAEMLELMCVCARERRSCRRFYICVSNLQSVKACMLVAHWVCICSCVPFHCRDGERTVSLFIFTLSCCMWPLTLSLKPFPLSVLSLSLSLYHHTLDIYWISVWTIRQNNQHYLDF